MGGLAILAGDGSLPVMIAAAKPDAHIVVFGGVAHQMAGPALRHSFETLGLMFEDLRSFGVDTVVMAGSMRRPPLDPALFDPLMKGLAPRLMAALQGGDDALLCLVIEVIEEQGFTVIGAHEVLPDLVVPEGLLVGPEPSAQDLADAARAGDILLALAPVDVGQGVVVADGLCLGIETIQGTDFLLASVARTDAALRAGARGVYAKAAKTGQDLRVDMPAIGPETVARVAAAGLAGMVIEADRVMVLERAATLAAADKAGLFILARAL